jgi:hypothetical protein
MRIKATVKAVNDLAHKEAARVKALLEAGARVAHAQTQALRKKGDPDALRNASRELAQMIEELTGHAEALLGIKPSPHTRRTIAQTLRAAATGGDETRELLQRGELEHDLEPASVFGVPGELPPAPPAPKASRSSKAEQARARKEAAAKARLRKKLEQQAARVAQSAEKLDRAAQAAEHAAWKTAEAAKKARERATAARHEADRLRSEAQRAGE